jgi:hypothetical protein
LICRLAGAVVTMCVVRSAAQRKRLMGKEEALYYKGRTIAHDGYERNPMIEKIIKQQATGFIKHVVVRMY